MKTLGLLAIHCVCGLVPIAAHAQGAPLPDSWCKNTAVTLWTNSSHPGGNGNGRLNEKNGGWGFKCFLQKEEHPYFFHVDMLENSRYGNTLAVGFGKQYDVLAVGPMNLYVGGALSFTYYEVRDRFAVGPGYYEYRSRGAVVFPFMPSVHVGIGYELPRNWGTISFQENRLLQGIRLRSIGLQYKF